MTVVGPYCTWPRATARYSVLRRADCKQGTEATPIGCAFDVAGAHKIIGSWRRWVGHDEWHWDIVGVAA